MSSDFLIFFAIFLFAATFGFLCKRQAARKLLWALASLSLAVSLGWQIVAWVDLSQCDGNLLKGISCPAPIESSTQFKLAVAAFAVAFFGMFPIIFLSIPTVIVAGLLEWQARRRGKEV